VLTADICYGWCVQVFAGLWLQVCAMACVCRLCDAECSCAMRRASVCDVGCSCGSCWVQVRVMGGGCRCVGSYMRWLVGGDVILGWWMQLSVMLGAAVR
jgi:hypothetical protein